MNNYKHGEYVIYGDESGDPSPKTVCKEYSVFALAFCVFSKHEYINEVTKYVKEFKFAFWGHDMTVLHSRKIRKQIEDFYFLQNRNLRALFMTRLTNCIESCPFTIISSAIDKAMLHEAPVDRTSLYDFCLEHCVEKVYQFLYEKKQSHKLTHIIIESRMPEENRNLGRTFCQILEKHKDLQQQYPVKLIFADKRVNNIGLQLADLIAYPIGRYVLNPKEKNLAFEVVKKKLFKYPEYLDTGLEIFRDVTSTKQKTSDLSEV